MYLGVDIYPMETTILNTILVMALACLSYGNKDISLFDLRILTSVGSITVRAVFVPLSLMKCNLFVTLVLTR